MKSISYVIVIKNKPQIMILSFLLIFSFFKDYNKKYQRSHLLFFLSSFFKYYVYRHTVVHTEHLCFILFDVEIKYIPRKWILVNNWNSLKIFESE